MGHGQGTQCVTDPCLDVVYLTNLCVASNTLYPPNIHCSTPGCLYRAPLKKAQQRNVVLFTLHRGALPAYAVHLACPGMFQSPY